MNRKVYDTLDWYQTRIALYDKQQWEQSLETKSYQNNFYCIRNKLNKVQDYIDIDLVKGSTFSKAKSNISLINILFYGISRIIFYPLFIKWWTYQLSKRLSLLLLVLYIFQLFNLIIYFLQLSQHKKVLTLIEIFIPWIIMLVMSIMYTYITSTLPSSSEYDNKTKLKYEKRIKSKCKKINHSSCVNNNLNNKTMQNNLENTSKLSSKNDNSRQFESLNISDEFTSDEDDENGEDGDYFIDNKFDETKIKINPKDSSKSDEMVGKIISNSSKKFHVENFEFENLNDEHTSSASSSVMNCSNSDEPSKMPKTQNVRYSSPNVKSYNFNRFQNQLLNLNAVKEKISCFIWHNNEWKGADLSMPEISNIILLTTKNSRLRLDYFYIGILFSFIIAFAPCYFHNDKIFTIKKIIQDQLSEKNINCSIHESKFYIYIFGINYTNFVYSINRSLCFIMTNILISTIILCILFFSLLTIAERTLNQRLLHAKFFCYLTSNRKARKHNLPHFRLNRVENIKTWLSIRSYIKKKGPQRSINAIISSTFLIGVTLCSIVCVQFLRDSDFLTNNLLNWHLVIWSLCIWTYMSRFMSVGFNINKKYHNCMSIVIMEQINLYLQIEKTSQKKDELTVVNNVLKLASDLLKEIEKPFRISGLSINPWIYNIIKVVILSAFSAVLSELFGFKLKLHKIKIN